MFKTGFRKKPGLPLVLCEFIPKRGTKHKKMATYNRISIDLWCPCAEFSIRPLNCNFGPLFAVKGPILAFFGLPFFGPLFTAIGLLFVVLGPVFPSLYKNNYRTGIPSLDRQSALNRYSASFFGPVLKYRTAILEEIPLACLTVCVR